MQFIAPYMALPGWWSMLMTKPLSRPGHAGPAHVAALHEDHRVADVLEVIDELDVRHGGEVLHLLRGRVVRHHPHVLAERAQRQRHRHLRADGVAVGAGVRDHDEALARADGVGHLGDGGVSRGRGHRCGFGTARVVSESASRCARRLLVELLQDLLDAVLVRDRLVEPELELGDAPQLHPAADLAPQERRGAVERLLRVLARRRDRRATCSRRARSAGRASPGRASR